jgi:putative ABC transport system permease protein
MDALLRDLRHTLRLMWHDKAATAAALLTLALGIGATTALFSVVHGVLLQPLPYPSADRLVTIAEDRGIPAPVPIMINYTFHAWREAPKTIDALAAYNSGSFTVTSGGEPERIRGALVSPELFEMLGVSPALGRFLEKGSERAGAEPTVVISHGLWQERFGSDPGAVGRTIQLDGRAHTIVGVARPDFYFPDRDARLWTPYLVPERSTNRNEVRIAAFSALARLAPGATPEQAAAEATAAARNSGAPALLGGGPGPGGPRGPGGPGGGPRAPGGPGGARQGGGPEGGPQSAGPTVRVASMVNAMTARIRPALFVLSVGVVFVLLIGCANVANLFLSRGVARERELAVRAAMGADRRRLLSQLLSESVVTALIGGSAGLFLGWALVRVLPTLAPADFPRLADIRVDVTVLAFAAVASIVAGLISGLIPALRASRVDLVGSLREGVGASSSVRMARLRAGLLVAEAALAVMLLIGSGLLIRSFVRLVNVDAGYTADNVLMAQIFLPGAGGGPRRPDPAVAARTAALADRLLGRLSGVPGVTAAAAGNMAPLGNTMQIGAFDLPGVFNPDGSPVIVRASQYSVTPGYADALGLRLRQGRWLTDADRAAALQALVVNDAFVRAYLNDGKPVIGRRFEGLSQPGVTTEIVGVVGDVLLGGLDTEPQPATYWPAGENFPLLGRLFVLVRTTGDPSAIAPVLRQYVRDADPGAALDAVGPLSARVSSSVSQPRFAAAVLAAFALLALALAAVGLYGVLSYNVSRRQREIGVRAALGASRLDILRLVISQGLGVTVAGLLLGVAGAAGVTRLMQQLLFGVAPLDPMTFVAAPLVLAVVALAACLVPARRAARTDPAVALRYE